MALTLFELADLKRDLDERLRVPKGHARRWGLGRSRAAGKRRKGRQARKVLRHMAKTALHASIYGGLAWWR